VADHLFPSHLTFSPLYQTTLSFLGSDTTAVSSIPRSSTAYFVTNALFLSYTDTFLVFHILCQTVQASFFCLSLSTCFVPFLPSNYLVNLAFDPCMVVTTFADWLATIHHQLSVYDRPLDHPPYY
jgi:hypothetical protein